MAAYNLSPVFQDAQLSDDVLPLAGGTLTWYEAGTTTPATVYQTSTGTAHTSPVVLNVRGEPPAPIWLANGVAYKCVLADADAVAIRTIDNIIGVGDTSVFPSEFTAVTIDSTGNGAKIWQDAAGNLALQTNQGSGTQNNVSLSSTKTSSDKPITAPKVRIGDTTVPTLPVEVVGNGYVNGKLRVGDTTTPTQALEVAGNVTVTGDISPGGLGPIRYRLTAARTYYVRTDGSDANNGLADTAGGAFRTIQRAIDVVSETLDLGSQQVTIYVRAGTYAAFYLRSLVTASTGGYSVTIEGDITTPSNVVVISAGNAIYGDSFDGGYRVRGFRIASSGASGISIANAWLAFDNCDFSGCVANHITAQRGAVVQVLGNYSISANAVAHIYCETGSVFYCSGVTLTLTGTPGFATAFAFVGMNGTAYIISTSFVGSATGVRYNIFMNGSVYTNGLTLPGGTAGTTTTGGQYA